MKPIIFSVLFISILIISGCNSNDFIENPNEICASSNGYSDEEILRLYENRLINASVAESIKRMPILNPNGSFLLDYKEDGILGFNEPEISLFFVMPIEYVIMMYEDCTKEISTDDYEFIESRIDILTDRLIEITTPITIRKSYGFGYNYLSIGGRSTQLILTYTRDQPRIIQDFIIDTAVKLDVNAVPAIDSYKESPYYNEYCAKILLDKIAIMARDDTLLAMTAALMGPEALPITLEILKCYSWAVLIKALIDYNKCVEIQNGE